MRVKRLEVQGFKSFKDKTVIHFDHRITGIVGPNGCGKSNIVDAFFWVMGEQSYKHMRGTSSDDLIFNGSSKYSPLGMAEATLVLESVIADAEATTAAAAGEGAIAVKTKEVSVTRRLYRSGEGEYFINGVPARLKDIHELFMDTGIGAKGYSVIEQGQIGKIVNAKPEERRLLIEEAAGIAKYKARKKESLRKMEATQSNLSRLNDVIQEIERNLGSLERQAQKARQYKKYKEELLDKEMTWGRRKIKVLRQKLDSLRSQRDAMEQELVGLRAELQTAENQIEIDRVEQVTDSKVAEDLQARIQDMADNLAADRSALDLSRRRQSDLNNQLQTLENEKQELVTAIDYGKTELTEKEASAETDEYAYQEAVRRAQEMDEQVRQIRGEADMLRRQVEDTKRELMTGISRNSELNSRAASLLSRIESAQEQTKRLTVQEETLIEKLNAEREEAEKARISAEEIRNSKEQLQAERREQSARLQTQEQELKQLERAQGDSLRSLTQLKSRLQSLEELSSAHEGFGDGPKAVLDWAKENGKADLLTTLADTLEVSKGYEGALEGWLESRLEALVSQDAALAVEAIEQIRQDNQGRVAIHLAASVSADASAASFAQAEGALKAAGLEVEGELSKLVQVSKKFGAEVQEAASRTIRHVCVVKSFESLNDLIGEGISAELQGWSIVDLNGSVLSQDGVLRGGRTDADGGASLLRRKAQIAELQTQVAEAEATHEAKETALAEARQTLDIARARLQTLQADYQALEIQAAALERDVHQMARTVKDTERQLEQVQREREHMQGEAERATSEREKIAAQVTEFTSNRDELDEKIAAGETALAEKDAEVRSQEAELQMLKVSEASLRERSNSLKRELEGARSLIRDRERRLNEINRTLERATQEREQFTGGESGLEQRIEELTKALGTAREELSIVKDRLEQGNAKANATLEKIKKLHKTGDLKTQESNQLALEIEKISAETSHLVQNLEEKYGPGCLDQPVTSPIQEEMTDPVVTAEMTAEEEQLLGEEVERLRERIRRLGEVNVMAIEEFEEAKKRHDYLLGEKKDLETSIENLQAAIEHINKTSEERFKRAFEAIADRFQRLFPIIFGGGSAKLSLLYPEGSNDVLEAGVDILAQPPGKKVSSITLLSGGEKALTAVSLIFAIFMVKPSPFCLLDEVDAPLDDANIGKFNALLREMSAKSQFILITHNKKTMELNDTLYGVTMEEPGVSKMVSIEMH